MQAGAGYIKARVVVEVLVDIFRDYIHEPN